MNSLEIAHAFATGTGFINFAAMVIAVYTVVKVAGMFGLRRA